MTRRDFLLFGAGGAAAGAAALAFGRGMAAVVAPGRTGFSTVCKAEERFPLFDHVVKTTCAVCPAGCGIQACIRGSSLVMARGNPDHPENRGAICPKCLAGLNALQDPERLLYPLKRTGSRGGGGWTRVSWDEALAEISRKIADLRAKGQADRIVFEDGSSGFDGGLAEKFFEAAGSKNVFRPGSAMSRMPALEGSRTLVAFCGEILEGEAGPMAGLRTLDLMARSGTVIAFDPVLTMTASRSRTWHPLKPGTEAAAVMALACAMSRLAPGPFGNGAFEKGLEGFEPGHVEKAAGLKKGCITEAAGLLAADPAFAVYGGMRLAKSPGGFGAMQVIEMLNSARVDARTGGLRLHAGAGRAAPEGGGSTAAAILDSGGTSLYFASGFDRAASAPECGKTAAVLADETKVPFVVVHDMYMTRTAGLADIVLPLAGPFESWGARWGETVSLVRPASLVRGEYSALKTAKARGRKFSEVRNFAFPPGEARSLGDALIALGKALGPPAGAGFGFEDAHEYVEAILKQALPESEYAKIIEDGFAEPPPAPAGAPRGTPRLSIPAPAAEPAAGEFMLLSVESAVSMDGLRNSKWLREMAHENPLLMNKGSGRSLGIETGDAVRVSSRAGSIEARVKLVEGIHPAAVAMRPGFGSAIRTKTALGERFVSSDPDTRLLWWGKAGAGANVNEAMERADTGIGMLDAASGTAVRIEKI